MHNPIKPTIPETRCFSIWQSIKQWWQANRSRPVIYAGIDVQRDVVKVGGITMLASEYRPEYFPERIPNPLDPVHAVEALLDLELILFLEMAEMQRRLDDPDLPEEWKVRFKQKRIAFHRVAGWVHELRLFSVHPGQGGHSVCARDFNVSGKLSSIASFEHLTRNGIEVPADVVARGEFYVAG